MESKQKDHATVEGTKRYAKRFANTVAPDYFNLTHNNLSLSSIGAGTYLGESNDEGDKKYNISISYALLNGINVLDTAIKYRKMRSEVVIGKVLQEIITKGDIMKLTIVFV